MENLKTRSRILFFSLFLLVLIIACEKDNKAHNTTILSDPYLLVLGIAQDAGYPQAGCQKECCTDLWKKKTLRKMVTCIGLVDPEYKQTWLFEATPDFPDQLQLLNEELDQSSQKKPHGIFLTHAHIGHYTGLMHLGREAMGAKAVPVWGMPRMNQYLTDNGPWSQLVKLENIQLHTLKADSSIQLNPRLTLTPFLVPHRDEFSETVGFQVDGPNASAIFIPDIDKWEKWDTDIVSKVKQIDYAFLDGTFYANGEIPGRDMALIPHPFIEESKNTFSALNQDEKRKIQFIHFNHTNPVLKHGKERKDLQNAGFGIAEEGQRYPM